MREIQDSDGASPRRAGGIFNRFAWARAVEILARYPVSLRFAGRRERMRRGRVWVMCAVDGGRLSCFGERSFSPGLVFSTSFINVLCH